MRRSFLQLVAFLLLVRVAGAVDYKPLPLPSTGPTGTSFAKDLPAHYQRTLIDAYNTLGHHDPRWDVAVVAYLGTWRTIWSIGKTTRPLEALLAEADAIIDLGCEDPQILYLSGRCLSGLENHQQALERYRKAKQGYQRAAYDPIQLAYCGWRICQSILALHGGKSEALDPELRDELNTAYMHSQVAAGKTLRSAAFRGRPEHCLFQVQDLFSDKEQVQKDFIAPVVVAAAKPGVDPWVRAMLEGEHEINLAWKARGSGYSNTVAPEGWKGFTEHLAKAREHLQAAHRLRPDLPHAATAMITVSMGNGSGQARLWFDLAAKARFDHLPAYEALQHDLRPRWHGSYPEMIAFGRECLRTKRFDTEVPVQYLVVLQTIHDEIDHDPALWTSDPAFAGELDELLAGLATAQTEPSSAQWYRAMRVAANVACGRKAEAVVLAAPLTRPLPPRAWKAFEMDAAKSEALLTTWIDAVGVP